MCSRPVTSPSSRARSTKRAGSLAQVLEREVPAVDRRRARTPARCPASRRSGGPVCAYQPRSAGDVLEAALGRGSAASRARGSGPAPEAPVDLQRDRSSSSTTDEFDCSAPIGRTSRDRRRSAAPAWRNSTLPAAVSTSASASDQPHERADERSASLAMRRPRRRCSDAAGRARACPGWNATSSASRARQSSTGHASSSTRASATSWDLEPNQRCSARARAGLIGRPASAASSARPEQEPVEAARRERQQVGQLADAREARAAEHLDRVAALEGATGRARPPARVRATLCTHSTTSSA